MENIEKMIPNSSNGTSAGAEYEGRYVFFKVKFNNFREVSESIENAVLDKEVMDETDCVLWLPDSYTDDGEETQLILSFHGAGSTVCEADKKVGGVKYVSECVKAGYAALDIAGAAPNGLTLGCPEHLFAIYKAYKYAIKHYNLSERVLVAGASMGGHVAMNFINMFPSIVISAGLIYPRLNIDGVTINDHYCIGTWDKCKVGADGKCTKDRIVDWYHFPSGEWYEKNTVGFNPYRTRSFINSDGERVLIPPCPIKVWQGTDDKTVDPVMVEEFVRSIHRSGTYAELHLMEGVGHKINSVMKEEILIWFNRFI